MLFENSQRAVASHSLETAPQIEAFWTRHPFLIPCELLRNEVQSSPLISCSIRRAPYCQRLGCWGPILKRKHRPHWTVPLPRPKSQRLLAAQSSCKEPSRMETPLQEAQPSYLSHRQHDAHGRSDPKCQHLQQSKPKAPKAETLGAHQHSRLRSVSQTTNQSTPMCNR